MTMQTKICDGEKCLVLEGFAQCDTGVLKNKKNSFVIVPSEDSHDLWEMERGADIQDLIRLYADVGWVISSAPTITYPEPEVM